MQSSDLKITESSPSVQTHLNILQSTIQRMASNSSQCKALCITIVSAILVIIADKEKPEFVWIALLPSLLFLALDAYYLGLEKGFRKSYNHFIDKLHNSKIATGDLYSVNPIGERHENEIEALFSFSIWGFYSGLIALIIITRFVVLE